ncbi:DUF4166 domain-containing protein [Microbacterium sp. NPDC055903]
MRHPSRSPYTRALGARAAELHPELRQYFSGIDEGMVGVGEGVFDQVGTPRRWLHPLLYPLQRRGILVAGWYRDVPFRIENRTVAGRAVADRVFRLPFGDWIMRDAVAVKTHGRLVDELGEPPLFAASFDVHVQAGALRLRSRAVGLRLGRLRFRAPGWISPVVTLTERFDDASGRQRVSLKIRMPLLGLVYEYAGSFDYRIEQER